MSGVVKDPWARLRAATPARIGLGRTGAGLPVAASLEFQHAHARARDAVHRAVDWQALRDALAPREVIGVASRAPDRATYLRRPDLGRRLGAGGEALGGAGCDIAFVVADGLSADAVQAHAAAVIGACEPQLEGLSLGPVVLAEQGRVAIGDEIGAALGARLVVLLVGERPGLTVADSLGAYLTFDPRPGCRDSARNCVSNIHLKGGLGYGAAAAKIGWLAREALRRGLTGIALKDEAPELEAEERGRLAGD
ncbi:ethanolamine ammonia-lyase subunit EutC [Mangrovicoccus algicola]|uniref:Ethanolamine ammonia-lyase small subunit n=1 Tax=Mangrovicoccus algicola TaxID=2771008 RepID=A0A8J6ZCM0_9RHOB|nr:ethanolamine ammonia-lyase subunit EutC [Mangrovicoccus algicola]MBE3639860.1 ethanolamine ammonia-lyase subunit EutC [Mangrovicoccus algicola]